MAAARSESYGPNRIFGMYGKRIRSRRFSSPPKSGLLKKNIDGSSRVRSLGSRNDRHNFRSFAPGNESSSESFSFFSSVFSVPSFASFFFSSASASSAAFTIDPKLKKRK